MLCILGFSICNDGMALREKTTITEHLFRLKFGGKGDALSVLGLGVGLVAMSNPLFWAAPTWALSLAGGAGMLGAWWLSERAAEPIKESSLADLSTVRQVAPSALSFHSDEVPLLRRPGEPKPKGIMLGIVQDTGEEFWLPDAFLIRHGWILGQSGYGKTVVMMLMLYQQMMRGGGAMFMDAKMSAADLLTIHYMAFATGRAQDLYVLNPGNPAMSNTWNPCADGLSLEKASRIMAVIEDTGNNAFYRGEAFRALLVLLSALDASGYRYTFSDLCIMFQSEKAFAFVETSLHQSLAAAKDKKAIFAALTFFSAFKTKDKEGNSVYNMDKVKNTFSALASKMQAFASGYFGEVMNTYYPDVRLFEIIRRKKILVVQLPTMGMDEAAVIFGHMFVADLRTALAATQALPDDEKPEPPFLFLGDEAGSYIAESWNRIPEQVRSARFAFWLATQTPANFEAISPELKEMVTGNTYTKLFFNLGTPDALEEAAEFIGKEMQTLKSLSQTSSSSVNAQFLKVGPDFGQGQSGGESFGEREQEGYRVAPDHLRELGLGECIVTYGGSTVCHLRVPMVQLSDELKAAAGQPVIKRRLPPNPHGQRVLGLQDKLEAFLDMDR